MELTVPPSTGQGLAASLEEFITWKDGDYTASITDETAFPGDTVERCRQILERARHTLRGSSPDDSGRIDSSVTEIIDRIVSNVSEITASVQSRHKPKASIEPIQADELNYLKKKCKTVKQELENASSKNRRFRTLGPAKSGRPLSTKMLSEKITTMTLEPPSKEGKKPASRSGSQPSLLDLLARSPNPKKQSSSSGSSTPPPDARSKAKEQVEKKDGKLVLTRRPKRMT